MQLYLIRHGLAEERAPEQTDAARALTDDGKKRVKRVVKGLRELDIKFDRVLSSPWTRAAETAELLSPLCDVPALHTELLCQSPRAELLTIIGEHGTDTALVGHEPWLGELVAWLAFGDTRHSQALSVKKAGLVWMEGSAVPGGMQLRALVPPAFASAAR